MKKTLALFVAMLCVASLSGMAQMFTTSPAPLQESSSNVVITFHAEQSGVAALKNLPESTGMYAHIGCYTTKSPASWSHVVANWGVNKEANTFTYVSPNTYDLAIGDLRTYFGITDPDEHVTKVCIIARNEKGTVQTSDQFIDVVAEGFQMELKHDAASTILTEPQTVKFTVNTSEAADITISVNGKEIGRSSGAVNTFSTSYGISDRGAYTVTAVAKAASGATATETLSFLFPAASTAADYPGGVPKMGPVKNADGSVTFCLAAPGKSSVIIVPAWDDYAALDKNVMKYHDYEGYRYFWTTVTGLDNDKPYPYYFVVDGSIKVGDPYARLVLDNYSDKWLSDDVYPDRPAYPYDRFDDVMLAVYQGNINDYSWRVTDFEIPDHSTLNIYELLFRDFTGSDSKDDGTVRKAIEKIPYIKHLGFNAVELMPIMEFNGNNSWGYNTNFYFAPDKSYGSPDDYKEFIDRCHEAGIAVILDIVFNQSDGLHPWYMMYPIMSNPFYNAKAPHDYSVLNDWKQENPLVQQQWADCLTYWMTEYKVDGFRFDLVKGLGTSYPSGTEAYNKSRVEVMTRLHNVLRAVNPNAIHINENLAGTQEENEMGADGQLNWSQVNNNACQYAMGWPSQSELKGFYAPNWGRTAGTTVSYAESHDEERMGYKQIKWGAAGVKDNTSAAMLRLGSVAAQMLMTPGAKMVWQFGEVGADQTTKDANGGNNTNPKKVLWSYLDDPDRLGLHDTYHDLLHFRLDNPELFNATAECIHNGFLNTTGVRSIVLRGGGKELVVLLNPALTGTATVSADVNVISGSNMKIAASSAGFTAAPSVSGGKVSCDVPAHSFVAVCNNICTGIDSVVSDFNTSSSVYTEGGRILVAGNYNSAAAYNLAGVPVAIGETLIPGVYIVNVDGNVTKVAVK